MSTYNASKYHFFNEMGECNTPCIDELTKITKEGMASVFVLDSCVCLDLIKLVDHKAKARIDKDSLFHLLELVSETNSEIFALGGILEMSHQKESMILDKSKFMDFFHRIKFAGMFPYKLMRSYKYDFSNYFSSVDPFHANDIIGFNHLLLPSYCALLKIRQIAKFGVDKQSAISNIEQLFTWMTNELDIFMGVEFQLGMNVFGGLTEFRRMVHLDGDDYEARKKLMGTAWDILHYRMMADSSAISAIIGKGCRCFFVTRDSPFYKLVKSLELALIVDGPSAIGRSKLIRSGNIPIFYDHEYINKLNLKMVEILPDRAMTRTVFDKRKISQLICSLETLN